MLYDLGGTLMRKSAVVLVAASALGWALPASADQSQAGCAAYGAAVAAAVQANIPAGAVVSGIATSGPGAAPAFVASFKAGTCS
jgi:hypothetical protein